MHLNESSILGTKQRVKNNQKMLHMAAKYSIQLAMDAQRKHEEIQNKTEPKKRIQIKKNQDIK